MPLLIETEYSERKWESTLLNGQGKRQQKTWKEIAEGWKAAPRVLSVRDANRGEVSGGKKLEVSENKDGSSKLKKIWDLAILS